MGQDKRYMGQDKRYMLDHTCTGVGNMSRARRRTYLVSVAAGGDWGWARLPRKKTFRHNAINVHGRQHPHGGTQPRRPLLLFLPPSWWWCPWRASGCGQPRWPLLHLMTSISREVIYKKRSHIQLQFLPFVQLCRHSSVYSMLILETSMTMSSRLKESMLL